MAENFLEGRADIDEFLTSFMEKRTVRKPKFSPAVKRFEVERALSYWPILWCFAALPQQKSQRGKVATVYKHSWTVSHKSLEHKVTACLFCICLNIFFVLDNLSLQCNELYCSHLLHLALRFCCQLRRKKAFKKHTMVPLRKFKWMDHQIALCVH